MTYYRKSKVEPYAVLGILFTVGIGTLLHFVFDWTKHNRIIAFIAPINESTWEHLKLLIIPMLIYSIFEYVRIGNDYDNYMIAKAFGVLSGMLSILMLFYTYSGILGRTYVIVDIVIFYTGVVLAFVINAAILKKKLFHHSFFQPLGAIIIMAVIIATMWFSYFPPKINLFLDPLTKTYGLN